MTGDSLEGREDGFGRLDEIPLIKSILRVQKLTTLESSVP